MTDYIDPDLATDVTHAARVRLAREIDRVCKRSRAEDAVATQDILAMLMDAYMRTWTKYYGVVMEQDDGGETWRPS